ncbi:MAG: hypothetical protein NWQ38_03165 [Cellulophaga sp.]|nr:hypothetical protein [Cellulophaga sp.]
MNYYHLKNYFFIFLLTTFSACGENENTIEPIITDISVISAVNSITFTNSSDLIQKLDNSLSYNYGLALDEETEKQQLFNADSTQVTASIGFKLAFQSSYKETNTLNNSVIIELFKEIKTPTPSGVELKADGPGNTYALITSVLAPGHDPIEVPDCNHTIFGNHIDELFDSELNTNVFRFFMHTTPDNDRCINFDRQRNEIKSYGPSPDNLLGIENETVVYKWKLKLSVGFQSSPNFTHIHQLKSVGGDLEDMPMYTLTTRKGNPDRIELRYAETDNQITLTQTDLTPFLGTWVSITETIKYGTAGTYNIEIKKVSDNAVLMAYSNNSIINWRANANFVRPKWGIYRSLQNPQDLRDEEVLFADFSITELD